MKINKAQLTKALEIVKPGLANKEMIEQSTSFAFIGEKVVTYNDEISISHPVPGLELKGAIKADELYKLLNKIKQEQVEFELTENEIIIKTGKTTVGLTLQHEVKLPLEEIGAITKWKTLPKDFIDNIKFAVLAVSNDMSRPILTCIHVTDEGAYESSDGFKLLRIAGEKMPVKSFLLPATTVAQIIKVSPDHIAEGQGWIHFQNSKNGTILSCRIFEDQYPNVAPLLVVKKGIDLILPNTITEILDRASVFSKRDHFSDEQIILTICAKKIKIESASETGWFEEEIPIRYDGEEVFFAITPYLLGDILNRTKTCTLSDNRITFKEEGWQYLAILRETPKKKK